ncbi:MAG: hypothetical protein GY758_27850 [Fuerstiella sp.]|nr:hypothetical protein [Fuerstiella sp.]MCP4507007.1 hypothetical protein [Fuerstiella sp.]
MTLTTLVVEREQQTHIAWKHDLQFWKLFQNSIGTTSGNLKRQRRTVNESIPETILSHASGCHGH